MRLSTFARVCLRLLAFSPLRLLAFVSVCLRLFAFARICLRPPLLRPPLRDTEWLAMPPDLGGHYSRDRSEYVNVIRVISDPFACEFIFVNGEDKIDCMNSAFSLGTNLE